MKKTGIYIHWPFCKKKCDYCDFASFENLVLDDEKLLIAYNKELQFYSKFYKNKKISSIFFGGGTPSLMTEFQLQSIMKSVHGHYELSKNCEITVECNPDDVTQEKLTIFKNNKINRISLGVQSFLPHELSFLSRTHKVEDIMTAIDLIKKNFENFSIDIIYSLPNQNIEDIKKNLKIIKDFDIPHLSIYTLMIKENTEFYKKYQKSIITPNNADKEAEMFEFMQKSMKKLGYDQYEISSFAKASKYKSVHNQIYWHCDDYIPIGTASHGRVSVDKRRYEVINEMIPKKWLEKASKEEKSAIIFKGLKDKEIAIEVLSMGLRLKSGINKDNVKKNHNINIDDFLNMKKVEEFQKLGFINNSSNKISCTKKGMILADYITKNVILL